RIPELRAGRRLLHLARIRSCRSLPPQRRWRSRDRHRGSWRCDPLAATSAAAPVAPKMRQEARNEQHGRMTMRNYATRRVDNGLARGCAGLAACALLFAGAAWAQSGEPIKIGFSMALTGGLAPNGKSALLAQKIWEEDVNAKGGLLGRPVKLIYYDDKSSPAEGPAVYTQLLHIDQVDLIVGPYAPAPHAPAKPVVI